MAHLLRGKESRKAPTKPMRKHIEVQKERLRDPGRRFVLAKIFARRVRTRVASDDSASSPVDHLFGCGRPIWPGKWNIVSSTGTLASTLSIIILCLSGSPLRPNSMDVGTKTPPTFS